MLIKVEYSKRLSFSNPDRYGGHLSHNFSECVSFYCSSTFDSIATNESHMDKMRVKPWYL